MIEAWGRGIERIMEACQIAGSPKPLLRYERTGLWIEFTFPVGVESMPGDVTKKMIEKMTKKTTEIISNQILSLLQTDGALSVAEVAMQTGKSTSTINRTIQRLRMSGKIRRVGPDKGGHWEVIQDTK